MSKTSPTARTLTRCKKHGWEAAVVERFNFYTKRKNDLFGVIDIIAITDSGILGIQATDGSNHSHRIEKILAEPRVAKWIAAGGRLEVWSWAKQGAKGKRKLWTLRVEDIAQTIATQVAA